MPYKSIRKKREYDMVCYQRNRTRILKAKKEYRIKNRKKLNEYYKKRYKKNKKRILRYWKRHYRQNKDGYKQYYLENAGKYRIFNKAYHQQYKGRINRRKRNYYWANRNKMRAYRIGLYGLTIRGYNRILSGQGNKCAICEKKLANKGRQTQIDHDHKMGIVRGILCRHCNLGLGFFFDSIDHLGKAINYLKKYNKRFCHKNLTISTQNGIIDGVRKETK